MQEKGNILRILKETKEALKNGNSTTLKNLSNQTINTASLTQDPDNVAVAVIVYSLSKLVERPEYKNLSGWKDFYKKCEVTIANSIKAAEDNDEKSLRKYLTVLRDSIGKLSGRLKQDIQDVFRKASINKASKIYEHGLSMETTANLLGITQFELASYAGQKEELNIPVSKKLDVKSRIKLAMDMFS